ncbi:hypothetical protein HWC59_gp16 [Proteus phage Myduc]|uniref:Uncharacterized protein n=1 Tax=Proteus phage Myduc TaxID=2650874 RepID=A0A5J6TDQ5_9CAUD|nr:hypothetical protein HWC59_gp16 [Proteus phage Myduc]QFG06639.1 hypothetical protein CPT_Myduc_016 [Proteus phage Myduc]
MWDKLKQSGGMKRGEINIITAGKRRNNSITKMANNCLSLTHTLVEDEEMKLKVFKNGVQIN